MDETLRKWISEILKQHEALLLIAIRQRAKFEGWLKFELAAFAETQGAQYVEVESSNDTESTQGRSDITLYLNGVRYDVELKTPNTNWRMPGVHNKTRPITKNVAGIIQDAWKLRHSPGQGVIAFVLFPVPPKDDRWTEYLDRIWTELGIPLTQQDNCNRLSISLGEDKSADIIICSFQVPRHYQ